MMGSNLPFRKSQEPRCIVAENIAFLFIGQNSSAPMSHIAVPLPSPSTGRGFPS
jgi:hypothetical protein